MSQAQQPPNWIGYRGPIPILAAREFDEEFLAPLLRDILFPIEDWFVFGVNVATDFVIQDRSKLLLCVRGERGASRSLRVEKYCHAQIDNGGRRSCGPLIPGASANLTLCFRLHAFCRRCLLVSPSLLARTTALSPSKYFAGKDLIQYSSEVCRRRLTFRWQLSVSVLVPRLAGLGCE